MNVFSGCSGRRGGAQKNEKRACSVASSDSECDRVTSLVGLSSNGVDIGCPSSTRNTENYSQLVPVLFISHPES